MHVNISDAPNAQPVSAAGNLTQLSDSELLANTRDLVGASNRLLAALLAQLAEVEARGIHRSRACSSLYMYCIYELRLSEDAASRRACAARLVKQFPVLLDAIASGELHLNPSWENFVRSMCPIRELAPGDRPQDWANEKFVRPESGAEAVGEHPSQPSELLGSAPALKVPRIKLINFDQLQRGSKSAHGFGFLPVATPRRKIHSRECEPTSESARRG